jgi:Domain of unknown function (DUF5615)
VAGTFPLLTDEHISKALIKALHERGWDVVRAVDVFGQRSDDEQLFTYAAEQGRALVTTDAAVEAIAIRWLREWRLFRGLVLWAQEHQRVMSTGDFLKEFDDLARKEEALAYPIHHIKPRR